jgi:hypothetical protein
MFRVIYEPERGQRVPVRLWARHAAPDTVHQLQRLASQTYVVEFVAGMADAHVSDGVAVGSVFATERTVVPRALGGDLGCGMSARRIAVDAQGVQRRTLEAVVAALERAIPTGDATHRGRGVHVPDDLLAAPLSTGSLEHARETLSRRHLGTLGGGNHFLEIDRDAEGEHPEPVEFTLSHDARGVWSLSSSTTKARDGRPAGDRVLEYLTVHGPRTENALKEALSLGPSTLQPALEQLATSGRVRKSLKKVGGRDRCVYEHVPG